MPKIKVKTNKGIGPHTIETDDSSIGEDIRHLLFFCTWTADGSSTPTTPFPPNVMMTVIPPKGVGEPYGPLPIIPYPGSVTGICIVPSTNPFQDGEHVTYTFSDGSTTDPSSDTILP
ncbi:MAG: hypothetical protein RIR11_3419 [Bacteroidota bacterium]|jgi:hypothetical protein